jgi:hypothetical protein
MIPHHKSCGKLIAKAGLTEIKTILGWVIDLCCFVLALREGRFQDRLMNDWLRAQSAVPSRMFVRPSGKTIDPILQKTTTYSLTSFYNDYIEQERVQITELQIAFKPRSVATTSYDFVTSDSSRTAKYCPILHLADCVSITFEMQKKDEKSDTVHHKATKDVNMPSTCSSCHCSSNSQPSKRLKSELIRSDQEEPWVIIGRWSGEYIRKQIEEFDASLSYSTILT